MYCHVVQILLGDQATIDYSYIDDFNTDWVQYSLNFDTSCENIEQNVGEDHCTTSEEIPESKHEENELRPPVESKVITIQSRKNKQTQM